MDYAVFTLCVFAFGVVQIDGVFKSKQLYDHLFASVRYSPQLLPDCDTNQSVNASFNMALRQIIDLDEKAQMLSVNVWIRMTWTDCSLAWNETEFGGIKSILVAYEDVWKPDLANYDSLAEEEMMPGYDRFKPRIQSNGSITYLFPTVLRTICRVKVTYFPFDVQTCYLKFGSWSYQISEIDFFPGNNGLSGKGEDVSNYLENNEWTKLSLTSSFVNTTFATGTFRIISFDLHIQRRPTFYVLIILFPCVFVNLISLLGCCLPAESGEKISLEVTILLSLAVFLLVISELLPPDSDNYPLLGLFFACSMVLVGLRLVACIFVLNLHHGGRTGMVVPKWANKLVFCDKQEPDSPTYSFKGVELQEPDESCTDTNSLEEGNERHGKTTSNYNQRYTHNNNGGQNNIRLSNSRKRRFSSECSEKIINYLDSTEVETFRGSQWMRLARCLDRVSIIAYSIAYVTMLAVFIAQMTSS